MKHIISRNTTHCSRGGIVPADHSVHVCRHNPSWCMRTGTRPGLLVSRSSSDQIVVVEVVQKEGPNVSVECESGSLLRTSLLDKKVDIYTTWNKVWQCGGVGQCGTCVVEVLEDNELLSDRTDTEQQKLKGKPASRRLACQTVVGDGTNSGTVKIRTKP